MIVEAWLLLGWIVVAAAFLVVHAVVVWLAFREGSIPLRWRLLALLPPVAPGVAWAGGRRVAPFLWAVLLVLYLGLRLAG